MSSTVRSVGLIIGCYRTGFCVWSLLTEGVGLRMCPEDEPARPVHFPWAKLTRLAATDPWPAFEIVTTAIPREHRFRAGPSESVEDLERWGHAVEQLFAFVVARAPDRVDPGWTAVPDSPWEPIDELPRDPGSAPGGPYRDQAAPVLARANWEAPSGIIARWFAPRADSWGPAAREVLVTNDHCYVVLQDGLPYRAPLGLLRATAMTSRGERAFVFARRTSLVVPQRSSCEVIAKLDDILETRNAAAHRTGQHHASPRGTRRH